MNEVLEFLNWIGYYIGVKEKNEAIKFSEGIDIPCFLDDFINRSQKEELV